MVDFCRSWGRKEEEEEKMENDEIGETKVLGQSEHEEMKM